MYPILIQLGAITIYSLWVCIAIGFFTALIILNQLIKKDREKLSFIADHSLAIFFSGLIVSRLVFVLYNFNFYFTTTESNSILQIFYIWDKGLSIWGGIVGLALALAYFCRRKNENIYQWLDILILCTIGGLVFGNIGNFLDGRNYGLETNLPWGAVIENSRFTDPIHPVQIYAAIYCLLLTIILLNLYKQKIGLKEGNIALIGIAGYSFLRLGEEFLRGDESNIILGLREGQIYCIVALAISLGIFYFINFYKKS